MLRLAANLSMLFNELPFAERFAAAAAAGFRGVEYLSPYEFEAEQLAGLLRENELSQVLFNLPPGDWDAGERGIACLPGREAEFAGGVDQAIEYAAALGCGQLNCLAGIAPEGAEPGQLHNTLVSNLRLAADRLAVAGITLLIEPINTIDMPGFVLSHSQQACALIDEVAASNLKLQYDIYHMQIMEGDLSRTMAALKDRIAHVQIADNPGRHEPGSGEINYRFVLDALDRGGYAGWVGCEYRPLADTADGLGWARAYLDAAVG